MNISGISGSNGGLLRNQFQQFKKGSFNIQKNDLEGLQKLIATSDPKASSGIEELLKVFDQIDTNKDGISFQELQNFDKAKGTGDGSQAVGNQKQCKNCQGCGKCEKADKVGEASAQGGSGPEAGKSQGHRGHHRSGLQGIDPSTLPPVTKDDFAAYKTQLQSEGKAVPPELDTLIDNYDTMDGDKDGKVTFDEFKKYAQANNLLPPDPTANNAAGVTKTDLTTLKDQLAQSTQQAILGLTNLISGFDGADADKDGKINPNEFQAFLKANAASQSPTPVTLPPVAASLQIFATLNQSGNENGPMGPSQLFLKKLASHYGQQLVSGAGSGLQIEA